jgi:uroporphyrinogen decarboxylase
MAAGNSASMLSVKTAKEMLMLKPNKTLSQMAREKYEAGQRLVAPLAGFPGVAMTGSTIKMAQQNYGEHFKAIKRLADEFHPDLIFPLMDLAVEANALGRYTIFPRNDSATVPKEHFDFAELEKLPAINIAYDARVNSYIEMIKLMNLGLPAGVLRGAYVTGPYSLAGLIIGSDEAAIATMLQPEEFTRLCNFTAETIQEYVRLLIAAGAEVICVLEPSAVMLGPAQFREYSAKYVAHILRSCRYSGINTIYHTCGNTMHVIEEMIGTGVDGISLDSAEAGVDLPAAAARIPENVAIIGNINPAADMLYGGPDAVERQVNELLEAMAPYPNFILSTGCDLPQETPPANIHAFMRAGRAWRRT